MYMAFWSPSDIALQELNVPSLNRKQLRNFTARFLDAAQAAGAQMRARGVLSKAIWTETTSFLPYLARFSPVC